jgi:hypothetical protein
MRQGTVSKIENGLDVTLDTFLTHVASLGLEIALLPLGQSHPVANAVTFARSECFSSATGAHGSVDGIRPSKRLLMNAVRSLAVQLGI